MVAHPCGSVFTAARALQEWASHLKAHGGVAGFEGRMLDFEAYNALVGLEAIRARQAGWEQAGKATRPDQSATGATQG